MWCQGCHREVAAMPSQDGFRECPFCGDEVGRYLQGSQGEILRADMPHNNLVDKAANSTEPDSITSSSFRNRKRRQFTSTDDAPTTRAADSIQQTSDLSGDSPLSIQGTDSIRHWLNLASFFVLTFLVGQILVIGAFLAGHFGAWALGQLFVSVGISITLWMLIRFVATLFAENRELKRKLARIRKPKSRSAAISNSSSQRSKSPSR